MPKLRYSLPGMFAAVTFVAISVAGLTNPSYAWASVVWTAIAIRIAASAAAPLT